MADKPILFSGPMVRALLGGRKTQTRRVLQPAKYSFQNNIRLPDGANAGEVNLTFAAGDRFYVREAHALVGTVDPGWLLYRADGYESECIRHGFTRPFPPESAVRWRPSIHMPRWASRLTLIVTDVRVQRLQEITRDDAISEGLRLASDNIEQFWRWPEPHDARVYLSPIVAFRDLWNSLHGPEAWAQNPWVVALTFETHRCNIDQIKGPQA